jgi:hypothetical protein
VSATNAANAASQLKGSQFYPTAVLVACPAFLFYLLLPAEKHTLDSARVVRLQLMKHFNPWQTF